MFTKELEIRELDEAGNLTATYIQSSSSSSSSATTTTTATATVTAAATDAVTARGDRDATRGDVSPAVVESAKLSLEKKHEGNQNESGQDRRNVRLDVLLPKDRKPLAQKLLDVFLPAGYPYSVTEDYFWYQLYDSLQAFASSIAGLISSRAVLEGIGVGDTTASPTAALFFSIIQDCMGRLATIVFAHRLGTAIEPECKMYRLAADVFNDAAMLLDCFSPMFPRTLRVLIMGSSSSLRAVCGVLAGSSKASLSQHFAKWENIGELNAKDASQETVISLLGMLVGSVLVSQIKSSMASWTTLILLLAAHLWLNYRAVRAVKLQVLNRQRANILFSNLLEHKRVLGPAEVSASERIFERDGVLRWNGQQKILGKCVVGCRIRDLVLVRQASAGTSVAGIASEGARGQVDLRTLLHTFRSEKYVLNCFDCMTTGDGGGGGSAKEGGATSRFEGRAQVRVAFKLGVQPRDQIQAWLHALLLARKLSLTTMISPSVKAKATGTHHDGSSRSESQSWKDTDESSTATTTTTTTTTTIMIQKSLEEAIRLLRDNEEALKEVGWDLEVSAFETRSGSRLDV